MESLKTMFQFFPGNRPARLAVIWILFIAASMEPPASAQPPGVRGSTLQTGLADLETPGLDSEVAGSTGSVNLEAARDKESVSVVLAKSLRSWVPERRNRVVKLTLKGPIGADAADAELLTLDGLENFVTAKLGFTHLRWPFTPSTAIYEAQERLCEAQVAAKPNEPNRRHCIDQCDDKCFDTTSRLGANLKDRFERLAWGKKNIQLFGGEVSYGQAVFKYVDPESLEKAETTEYGNAFSVYAGLLDLRPSRGGRARSDILIFAGYRREETYTPGGKTELCTPLGDAGAQRCDSVVLGAPTRKERDLAFLELRRYFLGGVPIGVSPRLVYDFDEDVTAVEVPVYFVTDVAGGLIGGVRGVWKSDSDEVTLAAFIGKKLDFATP